MCGIVGYIGNKDVTSILINGLKRLEYRGYDSAGIAAISDNELKVFKAKGKINTLEKIINKNKVDSNVGIGHTRWATHGVPDNINAHPHLDCHGKIAVVHNGIIDNYRALRSQLERLGHIFKSDTDTEVIAHLIEEFYVDNVETAVRDALSKVEGAFGLAILFAEQPDKLVVARKGSPLVIGVGKEEYFVASDVAALIQYTKDVSYLEEGEIAVITKDSIKTYNGISTSTFRNWSTIDFDLDKIEKGGYEHFMLKEICEQPERTKDAMRGRLNLIDNTAHLGGVRDYINTIINANRIYITACGTSWHAALIGKYMLEDIARTPVEVEYASEFRYRSPIIDKNTVIIAISQSGETADTLAAVRLGKNCGATTLGIVNVVGSTIARETDAGVYLHAGPEIGVASTKAFTSQVAILSLLALMISNKKKRKGGIKKEIAQELSHIPNKIEKILNMKDKIAEVAREYYSRNNFLYLGRGYSYPVALEGALKLKEISYIHAEGYPAAEMKHGPIALIDENMPVVFVAPKDNIYSRILSNMEEVKARSGKIIAIVNEIDDDIKKIAHHIIPIPTTINVLSPLLTVIPLQLLAYEIAVLRGCNVDQPRNLAKSVTVE